MAGKINSKQKGNRGERQAYKILEGWWGSKFSKTPGSGAFATITQRSDLNVTGDVSTDDPTFPFCVEVKWRESWHMEQLLKSDSCEVWEWWEQTKRDAELAGKEPLMIFKRNHQPWFYMMPYELTNMVDASVGTNFSVVTPSGDEVAIGTMDNLVKTTKEEWIDVQRQEERQEERRYYPDLL
jgi:hypothetical protein